MRMEAHNTRHTYTLPWHSDVPTAIALDVLSPRLVGAIAMISVDPSRTNRKDQTNVYVLLYDIYG